VTLPAGVYHRAFGWDGHNWYGPSDTFEPIGAPFPPGIYELSIDTNWGSVGDGGAGRALARMQVRIVP
jgi:hypothetical protein